MQLILQSESTVDLKKTMSTFEDTVETPQIKDSGADIKEDICAVKTITNDSLSESNRDEKLLLENTPQKELTEEKCIDSNGIIKTNGYIQNKEQANVCVKLTSENIEISKENTENGSSEKSHNIESGLILNDIESGLILNESNNDNISSLVDIRDTISDNETMQVEQNAKDLPEASCNKGIEATDDPNTQVPSVLADDKDITDVSIHPNDSDVSAVSNIQADSLTEDTIGPESSNDKNAIADKLDLSSKELDIKISDKNVDQNVPAFSPNSDGDEKYINISLQLKQLDEDEGIKEGRCTKNITPDNETKIDTDDIVLKNIVHLSPVHIPLDEIDVPNKVNTENNEIIVTEDREFAHPVENKMADAQINGDSNVAFQKVMSENIQSKCTTTENTIEQETDITEHNVDTTPLPNETSDQEPVKDISDDQNVIAVTNSDKQSTESDQENISSDVMEVDADKIVPMKEIDVDTAIEDLPQEKHTKVKTDVEIVNQEETKNDKGNISDEKQINNSEHQNEGMDIDKSDIISITDLQENIPLKSEKPIPIEAKNNAANLVKKATIHSASDTLNASIVRDIASNEKKNTDNIVMDVDGPEFLSIEEKSSESVSGNIYSNDEVKDHVETPNQEIINIDKEDEVIEASNGQSLVNNKVKEIEKSDVISIDSIKDPDVNEKLPSEVEIVDEEDVKVVENANNENKSCKDTQEKEPELTNTEKIPEKTLPVVCKLSNTMDILSDEEDDPAPVEPSKEKKSSEEENKCINIDDDDDLMIIEETNSQDSKDQTKVSEKPSAETDSETNIKSKVNPDTGEKEINSSEAGETLSITDITDNTVSADKQQEDKTKSDDKCAVTKPKTPLISKTFMKTVTKNLAEMTRSELEDFCILRLVESVVDKSNLTEIKNKMKTMAQTIEDLKKKAFSLAKQNRDLQVVVKTVQENHRQRNANPMMPMKITRSVGMQVVLSAADKGNNLLKKKLNMPLQPPPPTTMRPARNMPSPKTPKPPAAIPVPRLVPASSPTVKSPTNNVVKITTPTAVRNTPPQRQPEKRPHSKVSPGPSVTVDLTDDEPPTKITTTSKSPAPPVRLVPSQNLMPKNKPQFVPAGNSPRKVYIPISGPQGQNKPGPGVIKNFITPTRPRAPPSVVRMQHTVRLNQVSNHRHPAPLPDAMKQYQPPTWKALPPAPDLKLSKVDNGIVISWKFEGYQPDQYEEVASFQLYAYQETPAPPSTNLWKKIGDIKALPLPMACTLTQFMSGFKYFFAVRAIDVRSRIGPFSLPGSIMLISK